MSNDMDLDVLRAIFASRVRLAKMTEEEAITSARSEWTENQAWIKSNSQQEKSFVWMCDEFDLEPDAVRRAIKERK